MIADCVHNTKLQYQGDNAVCNTAAFVKWQALTDVERYHENCDAPGDNVNQPANVTLDEEIHAILLPHQEKNQEPSVANDTRYLKQERVRTLEVRFRSERCC